ncbi:MAG: prepilin-type N-terminal cleavage/methylation domain-containing protein [Vicinamibacterales bacterium]
MTRHGARGFSIVELLVALTVSLLVTSAVFVMLDPAGGAFQTQPERADVEQRLRAAVDTVARDLTVAGSVPSLASGARSAVPAAAVFPHRIGRRMPDPAGSVDASRVSMWSADVTAPHALLAAPLASASGATTLAPGSGCVAGDASCGFRAGMTVAAIGPHGAWDLFTITGVSGMTLTLQHNLRDGPAVFAPGGTVLTAATTRSYFLKEDRTSSTPQLVRYDAAGGADVPVVDHVAALRFDYFGEAEPPVMVPGVVPPDLRVSYGPVPPDRAVIVPGFPAGENCVFSRSPSGAVVSRLASIAASDALVPLPPDLLSNGPWCPDAADPNRYDADLLRVRQVVMTVTVQSAVAALRGPAGPLFTRGGTARGTRLVPDRVARVVISPKPLGLVR